MRLRPKRPLFPPQDPAIADLPPARNKGQRPLDIFTMVGAVSICRRYFWSPATGGLCPVDEPLGVDGKTATCGARRIFCTLGVIHDFAQAGEDLYAVAGIRVSVEKLRQLVEQEGREVIAARLSGTLEPTWSALKLSVCMSGSMGCWCEPLPKARSKNVASNTRLGEQTASGWALATPSLFDRYDREPRTTSKR